MVEARPKRKAAMAAVTKNKTIDASDHEATDEYDSDQFVKKRTPKQQKHKEEEDFEEEGGEDEEVESSPIKKKDIKKKKTEPAGHLKVGDQIDPELEVVKNDGETVKLGSLFEEKGVVFFFYPKANTPGCTKQACGFRDQYKVFQERGYDVYGLSADSTKSQTSWIDKYELPYPLLSDLSSSKDVLQQFGVLKSTGGILRSHVIVEKGGKVGEVQYSISPEKSYEGALKYTEENSKQDNEQEEQEEEEPQDNEEEKQEEDQD